MLVTSSDFWNYLSDIFRQPWGLWAGDVSLCASWSFFAAFVTHWEEMWWRRTGARIGKWFSMEQGYEPSDEELVAANSPMDYGWPVVEHWRNWTPTWNIFISQTMHDYAILLYIIIPLPVSLTESGSLGPPNIFFIRIDFVRNSAYKIIPKAPEVMGIKPLWKTSGQLGRWLVLILYRGLTSEGGGEPKWSQI